LQRWEYDLRREAQLRRAGWKFWRVSGSSFYRNKHRALDSLWKFLEDEGVRPFIIDAEKPKTAQREEGKQDNIRYRKEEQEVPKLGSGRAREQTETRQWRGKGDSTDAKTVNNRADKKSKESQEMGKIPLDWLIWDQISELCNKDNSLFVWRDFAQKVAQNLKERKALTSNQKVNMAKLWKYVCNKGFKPRI
jgi:hypothetical protein